MISLNIEKVPSILKECFLFYSSKIHNYKSVLSGNIKYDFNYTENSALYNFANFLKENKKHYLNIDWLFDYFNYQFTYWNFIKESKEKRGEIYIIQLHWILGKKALKRFDSRTQKDSYFYYANFFPKFKIKKDDLIEHLDKKGYIQVEEEKEKNTLSTEETLFLKEENYKEKRFNTLEGFNICLNFTTLFKFNSDLCQKCNYKKRCKVFLKKMYPNIYQKRILQKFMKKVSKNKS